MGPGPKVIKLFPCSTQLSTNFQLIINTKILTNKKFLVLSLSDDVKMSTIVGILTFMSIIYKICGSSAVRHLLEVPGLISGGEENFSVRARFL